MEPFTAVLDARCRTRAEAIRFALIVVVVAAALIGGGVATAQLPILPVLLGSLGGVALFAAGYVIATHALPPGVEQHLDRARSLPPPRRRWIALWTAIGWFALIGFTGRYLGSAALFGALNVAVLLGLWRFGSRTAEELQAEADALAEEQALWEANQAAAQEAAQADLDEPFDDDSL